MTAIRLVTFDVTNTIIRVLGSVGQNYANVAAIYNKNIDPTKLDLAFRTSYKQYNDRHPNFGVNSGLTPIQWWSDVVKDSFRAAGSDDSNLELISHHLYKHFSTHKGWEVFPAAEHTLASLKVSGVKLGIISNFDDRLEKILQELALMHYFDFVLSSAAVKIAKPDPDIFKMALKMADVLPEETIHVGDNVITDYDGARSVGITGLLLWKNGKQLPSDVDPNFVINNLSDVSKYIK